MASGIWTAVSGAAAQAHQVDIVANNLANTDTIGFKKDAPTFKEYLATEERDPNHTAPARLPIKDKDFYPLDGRDQGFVVVDNTYTHFRQGPIRVTQNPLDVAIDGPGFIEVSTPSGTRWTRQGNFKLAADGKLVTSDGYAVLSSSGAPPEAPAPNRQPASALSAAQGTDLMGEQAARFISLKDQKGPLSITEKGDIYSGTSLVGKLSLAEFADPNKLRKVGNGLFELKDPSGYRAPEKTILRQGMVELSNVNPVEEMTNLIKANRMFEHDMKALKTYGELMGKEVNELGKL